MVGLNGRALPEFEIEQDHPISVTYARADKHNDQNHQTERPSPATSRRVRSSQTSRGPKPLLPRSLKEALQLAELLSKSKLIPKGFETPETCLVGILYGMEVGLSPIAALQRMAVIDGRPTIWGDAALALVQASGLLQSIKEELIEGTAMNADSDSVFVNKKGFEVSTSISNSTSASTSTSTAHQFNLTAICTVRREGRADPITGSFSVEDAKRAGLWQKPGPWTDYPKRMLIMRARAFALRDAFPDVLAGLYLREEFVGKERQAAKSGQDRSADDAEWIAAATNGTNGSTLNNADTQADDQHHSAIKASEREQAKTSSYDFVPNTHGPSDKYETRDNSSPRLSSQGLRRAPSPPPAPTPDEDIEKASGIKAPGPIITNGPNDHDVLTRDPQMSAVQPEYDGEIVSASDEALDPETLLDLLDSALCCALDLPTLEEIIDDFAWRLRPLSKDGQKRAQKIMDRHHRRVEGLDHTRQPQAKDIQSYVSQPNAKLPRGLKSLLPSLGIGRKPSTRRIETRGNRLSRSLLSWNARQPLIPPNVKLEHREDVPAQDHTPEVSE